jgi:NADH:ubiquinone oxidoreductase subunit 4 (subunit M)
MNDLLNETLIVMILLPLVGALLAVLMAANANAVRWVSLLTTLVTLALSWVIVANYQPTDPADLAGTVMSGPY